MNKFPYNNGHLMVVPNRHCLDFEALHENETTELFHLLKMATRVLRDTLHPHGFNIGINIGKAGGAGEDHLHVHVVPRWTGDTNFMPILGETKIIPQYLEKTYQTLHLGFKQSLKEKDEAERGETDHENFLLDDCLFLYVASSLPSIFPCKTGKR